MFTYDDTVIVTIPELLTDRAAQLADLTCAIFPDGEITYRALLERATALGKGLIAAGLKPGEHVAILMPNCADFLLAHFAVQLAGGRSVLLNARFKSSELRSCLGRSDAAFLITTDHIDRHVDFAELLVQTFPELAEAGNTQDLALEAAPRLRRIVLLGGSSWAAATGAAQLAERAAAISDEELRQARAGQDPEDTAVMIYTSGTTALPKICELSHASLQRSWRIYRRQIDLGAGEKVWNPMPFFHSGGIGLITGLLAAGATIVSTPHFDPDLVASLIERHEVEHLYPGFHTLSLPLLQSRNYDRGRWARFLRTMANIGPLGTQYAIRDMLPAGVPIFNLFGMSESSGVLTYPPIDAPEDLRLASSGLPGFGAQLRIVDPETLEELAAGQRGELQFRGAGAFRGYYGDPAATAATILPGGWIRTGDLARIDGNGYLFYLGRLKDMLRVGGENVAAVEIESFLSSHPAIRFVQVVGRPDARLGEVPVAFVELNTEAAADERAIIEFCKGKIASFKIPRQVVFVTQWPMSSTKVQKNRLREMLKEA